ncbi:hypothetical protein CDEST_03903 [Colletotrichum destructivum]|uniref:Uncharacterized protein n=1 Tax=Colletotrichum destructivum TaxID=34406 RepID=A0AAX4I684_9PEZI|nr:hypothetical protein CDEST_03903 [Colletotrichum destructivum]
MGAVLKGLEARSATAIPQFLLCHPAFVVNFSLPVTPRTIISSSITTSTTVTGAALLAIITPFVQPPDCTSYWGTTSVRSTVINGTTRMVRVVVSDSAASCYPPGWTGDKTTPGMPSFSPGVCPDGWVYWDMAEASYTAASTAFCCDMSVCVSSLRCALGSWTRTLSDCRPKWLLSPVAPPILARIVAGLGVPVVWKLEP